MNEKKKDEPVVISLSMRDYRLLQTAICAAQIHPGCSESVRQEFADLGWAIHCKVNH